MDTFTSAELARLRSQPQHFKPKLAIFKPTTVWSGTLDGTHSKGTRIITVATTSGTIADILDDTTLIIGEGISEQRLRIKTAAGATITLSENSTDWEDGQQLSALLYFELHPIFNRIVNSDGVVTYFEDFNDPYTDQNENFEPVVNIGPAAYVLELDCSTSGAFSQLEIDPSDSFILDSSIASYSWDVLRPGDFTNPPTVVQAGDNGIFTFYDPGDYYISATATASNGKTYTAFRPVMVRCIADGLPGSPFFGFSIDSLEGSRDTGYWSASITVFEDCNESDFPRNVPIVIYGTAAFGQDASRSTTQVPWHYDNTAHQRFVGWIREEVWVEEFKDKGEAISFEAVGLCGVLDELQNYPAWLRHTASPTDWTGMVGLNIDRMMYYYLKNRSTLLRLTDWHRTEDTRLMNYAEIPNGRMYTGLREFLAGTIFAEMTSDRVSALWTEPDGQMLQDAARVAVVTDVHPVTTEDHMNEITLPTTRDRPEISWLSIDGLFFDGSANTPLIAYAPGYAISSKGGDVDTMSGLVLPSPQADLNALAGRRFALKNNPFKTISYKSQGVYPYDIAPQASIQYSGLQSGTFREETITEADLLIRSISDEFTPSLGLTLDLELEMIIRDDGAVVGPNVPSAGAGVEGLFPPDIEGIDPDEFNLNWPNFSFDWPTFDFTIPVIEPIGASFSLGKGTAIIAAFNNDGFIYITFNWLDDVPVWIRISMGLDGGDTLTNLRMEVNPFSPLYVGTGNTVEAWVITHNSIYFLQDIFQVDGALVTTKQHTFTIVNGSRNIHASFGQEGFVMVSENRGNTGDTGVWSIHTTNRGSTWTATQVTPHYGTLFTSADDGPVPALFVSSKNANTAYILGRTSTSATPGGGRFKSIDAGASWATDFSIDTGRGLGEELHIPYDHTDENLFYYNRQDQATGEGDIVRQDNAVRVRQEPTAGGEVYSLAGPGRWIFSSYPYNKLFMSFAGRNTIASDTRAVFIAEDGGDTWTAVQGPTAVAGEKFLFVGISGNDADVAYLCGDAGNIGFTEDRFASIVDRIGNLRTDWPGIGDFHFLVGG